MKSKKIGILSGGISGERYLSLRAGAHISSILTDVCFEVFTIDWSAEHVWTVYSLSRFVVASADSLDTILDTCHFDCIVDLFCGILEFSGGYAKVIERHHIPYVGNPPAVSLLGSNKNAIKEICHLNNLPCIPGCVIDSPDISVSDTMLNQLSFPCFIKPVTSGSSIGAAVVRNENAYLDYILRVDKNLFPLLVEPYIIGREFSCGVVPCLVDNEFIATPIAEIHYNGIFFDSHIKEKGLYSVLVNPPDFVPAVSEQMQDFALQLHHLIGAVFCTRTDFIVDEHNDVHILEINTHPGMGRSSILPQIIESTDIPFKTYFMRILTRAMLAYGNVT